jgi:hypothetical protein
MKALDISREQGMRSMHTHLDGIERMPDNQFCPPDTSAIIYLALQHPNAARVEEPTYGVPGADAGHETYIWPMHLRLVLFGTDTPSRA